MQEKKPGENDPEIPGSERTLRDDAEPQLACSPERSPGLFSWRKKSGEGNRPLCSRSGLFPLKKRANQTQVLITIRDNTAERVLKKSGMVPVTANKQLLDNIVGHFSDILGCLIEIRSLSLMEDPTVEKDWISEQIVMYLEKAKKNFIRSL